MVQHLGLSYVRSLAPWVVALPAGEGRGHRDRLEQHSVSAACWAARDGLVETARDLGIGDLGDKPTGEVIMELLDWVSEDSSDLDEQIARRAAEAVLAELVRDGVDLEAPIEPAVAADFFRAFLVQYLTRTIVTPIAMRLTENASATRARDLERNIARVVDALVRLEVSTDQLTSIDWLGPDGAATVDRIRTAALDVLAGDDT